jgi:hypothetical protein
MCRNLKQSPYLLGTPSVYAAILEIEYCSTLSPEIFRSWPVRERNNLTGDSLTCSLVSFSGLLLVNQTTARTNRSSPDDPGCNADRETRAAKGDDETPPALYDHQLSE